MVRTGFWASIRLHLYTGHTVDDINPALPIVRNIPIIPIV